MTPQQQIRELRNKLLGEPKLEFGCEVEIHSDDSDYRGDIYCVSNFKNDYYKRPCEITLHSIVDKWIPTTSLDGHWKDSIRTGYWKLLGKPVSTNDLLLMTINEDDYPRFADKDKGGKGLWISEEIKLDLTKEIEQQDESVLLEIIKILT